MAGALEIAAGAAALYVGGRALGIIHRSPATPAAPAAPAPGTAPVPAGQMADPSTLAPPVPGAILPTAPPSWLSDPSNPIASSLANIGATYNAPHVAPNGLWVDSHGAPYQFKNPNDNVTPIGTPGYMPIEYAAYLAQTGQVPQTTDSGPTAGQVVGGIGTGLTIASTVATAAGATGAASTAAGVAAAAGAALAALGPVPGAYVKGQWARHAVSTLTAVHGDRVLAINVYEAPEGAIARGPWLAAAVEVSRRAAEEIAWNARHGLERMYGDHSHRVLGSFDTELAAVVAAERFADGWRGRCREISSEPACACPEMVSP